MCRNAHIPHLVGHSDTSGKFDVRVTCSCGSFSAQGHRDINYINLAMASRLCLAVQSSAIE